LFSDSGDRRLLERFVGMTEDPLAHTDEELAWHEAGHVVLGVLAGRGSDGVSLKYNNEKSAARTHINEPHDALYNADELRWSLRCLLAGGVVDAVRISEDDDDVADDDYLDIREHLGFYEDSTDWGRVETSIPQLLERYCKEPTRAACDICLEEIWRETVLLVLEHWTVVEALATALLQEGEMTGMQVRDLWESVMPLPNGYE